MNINLHSSDDGYAGYAGDTDTKKTVPLTPRNIELVLSSKGRANAISTEKAEDRWETKTTDTTRIRARLQVSKSKKRNPKYSDTDIIKIGEAAWEQMKREGKYNNKTHEIIIQYDPTCRRIRSYFKPKYTGLSRAKSTTLIPIWDGFPYTPQEILESRRKHSLTAMKRDSRRKKTKRGCCC